MSFVYDDSPNPLSSVIETWGGVEVGAMELYTDMFRLGEGFIQREFEPSGEFKANPIIIGHSDGRMHRKILFEDTFEDTLAEFQQMDWAFMSGCTYFGRQNTAERQSKLCALIFDIDGVNNGTLNNFFSGLYGAKAYPEPTYVATSGHGVHLYYVFDEPLDLYPNIKTQVKRLKYALTDKLWNRYTSTERHRQRQGINQGFRVIGSKAKKDAPVPIVRAWRVGQRVVIDGLNTFLPDWEAESMVDTTRLWHKSKVDAAEAKRRWPEWYERVVVGGQRGQWVVKEDLYRWWLGKISTDATYGHRYFCIMALAIYAAKCGIYDRERVRADAITLLPRFNELNPDEPFTEADVDSALDCLDARYTRFPRHDIAKLTDIAMLPNKRNHQRQMNHLEEARAIRDIRQRRKGANWWDNGNRQGAPTKRDLVRSYAAEHPEANHSEIARALEISRPTVIKWLKRER